VKQTELQFKYKWFDGFISHILRVRIFNLTSPNVKKANEMFGPRVNCVTIPEINPTWTRALFLKVLCSAYDH
jgi:hypothetical protein